MSLDAKRMNPLLTALDQGCARPTERIEDGVLRRQPESLDVLTNKVRREGENKSIPVVDWPVNWQNSIRVLRVAIGGSGDLC